MRYPPLLSLQLAIIISCCAGTVWAEDDQPTEKTRRIYLDEFRPRSELKTPEHIIQKAKFPCVNVHTHPGKLTETELDEMVAAMDATNIAVSVSLDGKMGPRLSDQLAIYEKRHPGRLVVFVRMDYLGDGDKEKPETWAVNKPGFGLRMADGLSDAVKRGAVGLKLTKMLGLYLRGPDGKLLKVDDPRFDPVWQRAGELGIPVLWHASDPIAFFRPIDEHNERWEELYRHPEWSFYGEDFPKHQEIIDARNRVIARHPKTTFICAHMADIPEDLAKLSTYLDRYPNMNVGIAARIAELGRQPYTARKFFLKYPDRILFGTDGVPPVSELIPHWRFLETWDEYFPYEDNPFPPQGFWNIYGIGLPDDVLRKVYYENAQRIIPGLNIDVPKQDK